MSQFDLASIVLEGITGSTAYGLATPDSDVDKHGVYQAPTRAVLGLFPPKETVVTNDPDITHHELAKFIRLAAKANPCPGSIFIRTARTCLRYLRSLVSGSTAAWKTGSISAARARRQGRSTSLGCSGRCCRRLRGLAGGLRRARGAYLRARPLARTHATGTGADVVRRRASLLAENALLRQQLLVPRRRVKRPVVTAADRAPLVVLAGRVRAWRQALLLVQPETLLRWHRAGFRSCWRGQARPGPGRPPLPAETIAPIRRLAAEHPRWGAERSRGALGKLGVRVAQRTSQTYRRGHRAPRPRGQTWATFLRNHVPDSWACDFLPVTDRLFRPLCACFVVELATRRVVHVGATRQPTDTGVAQQRREATPFGQRPRSLIRDHDGTCGPACARVAAARGITLLRTPPRTPQAHAVCARFLGRVRRACLDHVLVRGERQLSRVLREYVASCNRARPHQGLGQGRPASPPEELARHADPISVLPVLGGVHHTYRRAACGR